MASNNRDKQLPTIAPGPGPLRENRPLTKNKKSSSACLPCKQAKRKCTGRPAPCKACQNTQSDCIFDESKDLRRKLAAKQTTRDLERKTEDLKYYRRVLDALVQQLRTPNDEKLQDILRIIRTGDGNMDNIAMNVLRSSLSGGSPSGDASDTRSDDQGTISNMDDRVGGNNRVINHSRITVEKLCDNPLFQVPCSWTNVTDDDHLVSHLISVYFTWDHPFMQVVDQEMFLRAMTAGETSSAFCSPMLVNSILAVASTYSSYTEVYGTFGDATSRGQHFFEEAERQWKAQEGQPSLANIQALALMSHNLKLQGKDNASWLYLRQAVQLGHDIGIFSSPRSRHSEWDQMSESVKRASARTAWGIFIFNSQMSMESHKIPNLEVPKLSLNKMNGFESDTFWIPYPLPGYAEYPRRPANLPYVMIKLADLAKTILDVQNLFFDKAFDMKIGDVWEEVISLHRRLEAFLESLPDPRIIDGRPVPQMLFLHIKCHQIIILLLGFLLERQDFESTVDRSTVERVQSNRIKAAKQISEHLFLYRQHYELPHTPSLMFGPVKSSALALVPFLDDISAGGEFAVLWEFLESFSGRFPAAKTALCEIHVVISGRDISLP
ncbi:putative C6 transcription factor [Aspergillus lucknowensis]|uniref:Fungal-specific transcription factor domain-containing protein n=1 Tax=Aspergillus lucknowensis TaxID=176173 RepID=A0ABR4M792_9EURO